MLPSPAHEPHQPHEPQHTPPPCAGVLVCWSAGVPPPCASVLASWPDPQPCTCPGEVIEVNESLNDDPSLVNSSAEGDGWMTKVP